MKINNNSFNPAFRGLIVEKSWLDYSGYSQIKSLRELKYRMDKLENFDLVLTKDGPKIKSKNSDYFIYKRIRPSDKALPLNNELLVDTRVCTPSGTEYPADLYLFCRNREEARKFHKDFSRKNLFQSALILIEKLDYDVKKRKSSVL